MAPPAQIYLFSRQPIGSKDFALRTRQAIRQLIAGEAAPGPMGRYGPHADCVSLIRWASCSPPDDGRCDISQTESETTR